MPQKKEFRISMLSILVGIIIPIISAIIPYGYKRIFPERNLAFTVIGPVSVKGSTSFSIELSNDGEQVEKNVKILIRRDAYKASLLPKETKPDEAITIDGVTPNSINIIGDYYIIDVGDLRPEEKQSISITSKAIFLYKTIDSFSLSIKSDTQIAKLRTPSEFAEIFYPIGFWGFVLLMILLFCVSLYQEIFMNPRKKEEMLLRAIDRLPKKTE